MILQDVQKRQLISEERVLLFSILCRSCFMNQKTLCVRGSCSWRTRTQTPWYTSTYTINLL